MHSPGLPPSRTCRLAPWLPDTFYQPQLPAECSQSSLLSQRQQACTHSASSVPEPHPPPLRSCILLAASTATLLQVPLAQRNYSIITFCQKRCFSKGDFFRYLVLQVAPGAKLFCLAVAR